MWEIIRSIKTRRISKCEVNDYCNFICFKLSKSVFKNFNYYPGDSSTVYFINIDPSYRGNRASIKGRAEQMEKSTLGSYSKKIPTNYDATLENNKGNYTLTPEWPITINSSDYKNIYDTSSDLIPPQFKLQGDKEETEFTQRPQCIGCGKNKQTKGIKIKRETENKCVHYLYYPKKIKDQYINSNRGEEETWISSENDCNWRNDKIKSAVENDKNNWINPTGNMPYKTEQSIGKAGFSDVTNNVYVKSQIGKIYEWKSEPKEECRDCGVWALPVKINIKITYKITYTIEVKKKWEPKESDLGEDNLKYTLECENLKDPITLDPNNNDIIGIEEDPGECSIIGETIENSPYEYKACKTKTNATDKDTECIKVNSEDEENDKVNSKNKDNAGILCKNKAGNIIECDITNKKKNKYRFRPILLNNPFPGKFADRNGRNPGKNWEGKNVKIEDAKDAWNNTPKYTIDLTPQTMKDIRKMNDEKLEGYLKSKRILSESGDTK